MTGKGRRVITSFTGAGQKRSGQEVKAETKRKEVQKVTNALRKK